MRNSVARAGVVYPETREIALPTDRTAGNFEMESNHTYIWGSLGHRFHYIS